MNNFYFSNESFEALAARASLGSALEIEGVAQNGDRILAGASRLGLTGGPNQRVEPIFQRRVRVAPRGVIKRIMLVKPAAAALPVASSCWLENVEFGGDRLV